MHPQTITRIFHVIPYWLLWTKEEAYNKSILEILEKDTQPVTWWQMASIQPTECCHLSSILPAATQRLSLCKTDICPEAFFLFFLSSLFVYLSCNLCSEMYYYLYTWYLAADSESIAFVRKPEQDEHKEIWPQILWCWSPNVWLELSCLLHSAKETKCNV